MHQKVFIVGFMGSGKTTLARQISDELSMPFYDTDQMIEKATGMNIQDIFSTWGEKYFRRMERDVLYGLLHRQESFICSTGGGSVCQPDIMDWLNRVGQTIWLDTPWEIIQNRLSFDTTRPLAQLSEIDLKLLWADRKKFYQKASARIENESEWSTLIQ